MFSGTVRALSLGAGGGSVALYLCGGQTSAAERPKVLVTGFTDWREDGQLPQGVNPLPWRCRDNPSCRLILGDACSTPPIRRDGPLAELLRLNHPEFDWTFMVIPTLWGTAGVIDHHSYDVVINLGLGVYDSHTKILLEDGAYNARSAAPDAIGHYGGLTLDMGAPQVMTVAKESRMVRSLDGRNLGGGFHVERAPARYSNIFICNETHYRALKALKEKNADSRLSAAYFVHLPYAKPPTVPRVGVRDDRESSGGGQDVPTDYGPLAAATAKLIGSLVARECLETVAFA